MNALVFEYYRKKKRGICIEPILLSDSRWSWEEVQKAVSGLPRGWYELSTLSVSDRICFTRDFWQSFLPYDPLFYPFLDHFFSSLDDVGIVIQEQEEGRVAEMVYSLKDNSTFFRGLLPAREKELEELQRELGEYLPHDYLSFLKIHNGFGKLSEIGLLPSTDIFKKKMQLMNMFLHSEESLMQGGRAVDPGSLIPFYESSGFSFQCFFKDWYPGSEMGNVYLSGIDYTLSEIIDRKFWADQKAFDAFLGWLAFYLEGNSVD